MQFNQFNVIDQINKLRNLGFASKDCVKALETCTGNLDAAAIWLTQYAAPVNYFSNILDFNSDGDITSRSESFGNVFSVSVLAFQQLEVKIKQ